MSVVYYMPYTLYYDTLKRYAMFIGGFNCRFVTKVHVGFHVLRQRMLH